MLITTPGDERHPSENYLLRPYTPIGAFSDFILDSRFGCAAFLAPSFVKGASYEAKRPFALHDRLAGEEAVFGEIERHLSPEEAEDVRHMHPPSIRTCGRRAVLHCDS